jgi:ankyrin repeat protein
MTLTRPALAPLVLAAAVFLSLAAKAPDKKSVVLLKAAQAGSTADVEAALKAGADVDAVDESGNTALSIAAAGGHEAVAQALLAAKADPDRANGAGLSPLMRAAAQGRDAIVKALLAARADVAATDGRGRTALVHAARSGSVATVKALLAAGADVAAADQDGGTALHGAAAEGHVDVVKALLAAKADPRVQDANGQTPFDLAQEEGQAATAALVRAPGSKAPPATVARPASGNKPEGGKPAPGAPSAGATGDFASGTLTVEGSTVKLSRAYLVPDTGTPAAVLVFLSDGPVPRESLRDGFALRHLTEGGSVHVVRLRITNADKQLTSMEMHHAGLSGGRTGVLGEERTGVLTLQSFSPGLVEGKIAMAKPYEVPEGTYQYSASFRASLAGAAAVAAAAPAAASVADGKADGSFSVDGKATRLAHAAAWVDSKDEKKPVVLLLSDQPVPLSAQADDFALQRFAEKNRLHAIGLWFDKDQQILRGQIYDPAYPGSVSVSGMHTFEPSTFDSRTLSGRVFTGSLQSFAGHTWEYAASFKATIRR